MTHVETPLFTLGFRTDPGRRRSSNQDSYAVLRRSDLGGRLDALIVVADGMGGVGGGEVASGIVAQTVPEEIRRALLVRDGAEESSEAGRLLQESIERANAAVRARRRESVELEQMGSTCVAAILDGSTLTVANVGDSRAYLLRDGLLRQLTEDHSEVWQEVQAGNLSREAARTSKFRNRVTRGIGIAPHAEADVFRLRLQQGDTLLVCSDGLTVEVPDRTIAAVLAAAPDAQTACHHLVDAALDAGGSDNITVVVARYGEQTPVRASDEEEITDREQAWRASLPAAEDAYPDAEEIERHGAPLWAKLTIAVLALFVLAEAAGLYYFAGKANAQPAKQPSAAAPVVAVARPTDQPLSYGKPVTLLSAAVQDAYLALAPDGQPIVVDRDGRRLKVTATSTIELGSALLPPLRAGLPAAPPPRAWLTTDASGNIYQTSPSAHAILKYAPAGAPLLAAIARGQLTAPGALAVGPRGDIFLVDNHHLKRIAARPQRDLESNALRNSR